MSLIEVMIAVFIFSIGILAMVGVQATSLRALSDARFRNDAAWLANQLIADARVADRSRLRLDFDTSSADPVRYRAWLERVKEAKLPEIGSYPPIVTVSPDNEMTVTVRWRTPDNSTVRQYVVMTQFAGAIEK